MPHDKAVKRATDTEQGSCSTGEPLIASTLSVSAVITVPEGLHASAVPFVHAKAESDSIRHRAQGLG